MALAPFFTIGHSTRSLDEVVAMLRSAGVDFLADVRRFPRSRSNPDFNIDTLPDALAGFQIGYRHFADLGGRRPRQAGAEDGTNAFWSNPSFRNYADFALTPAFETALAELITLGETRRCAIMCSEAVWWRCHRRIIADHLLARGHEVFHLMGGTRMEPARLTRGAQIAAGCAVIYPA